jgi:pilus assembly protein FimV
MQTALQPLAPDEDPARERPALAPPPAAGAVDLDLDLDLSGSAPAPSPARAALLPTAPASELPPLGLAPEEGARSGDSLQPLDFELSSISLDLSTPAGPAPAAAGQPLGAADLPSLDLDLGTPAAGSAGGAQAGAGFASSRSWELSDLPGTAPAEVATPSEFQLPDAPAEAVELGGDADPLARKIELAEEFQQIGDEEGARELLREVLAQADGEVKAQAQALLDRLG